MALLLLASLWSCGGGGAGGSSAQKHDKAVSAVEAGMAGLLGDLSSSAGKVFSDQLETKGEMDLTAGLAQLKPQAQALANRTCDLMKEDKEVAATADLSLKTQASLDELVNVKVLSGLGAKVAILNAMNVAFPPFMLIDPAKNPPFHLTPSDSSADYLKTFLKPEFITPEGGPAFPAPTHPSYQEFLRWTHRNDNRLAERAISVSDLAVKPIDECLNTLTAHS